MKGLLPFIVMLLFVSTVTNAQLTQLDVRTKTISEERVLVLNSKLRGAVAGGQSRLAIPLDVPNGTLEWFYSFTTTAGEQGTKNLNLAIQLSSLVLDPSGNSAKILSQLDVPGGTNAINVYVLDPENKELFLQGDAFDYIELGSSEATKEGGAKVTETKPGRWYLGLHNPSALDGVNVAMEAVAIVTEVVYTDEWSPENLSLRKSACLNSFRSPGNDTAKQAICDCFVEKLKSTSTPRKWGNLGANRTAFEQGLLEQCYIATGQTALRDQEQLLGKEQWRVTALMEEAAGAYQLRNYQTARDKMQAAVLMIQDKELEGRYSRPTLADFYSTLAWYAILTNELELAENSLEKGHALVQEHLPLWGQTVLYHLMTNNSYEAEQAAARYKRNERLPDGQRWDDFIAEHLNTLERLGLGNEHFDTIRTLLKIK